MVMDFARRKENTKLFMNVLTGLSENSGDSETAHETLSYVMADPRYLDYMSFYLENSDLSPADVDTERARAEERHAAAKKFAEFFPDTNGETTRVVGDLYTTLEKEEDSEHRATLKTWSEEYAGDTTDEIYNHDVDPLEAPTRSSVFWGAVAGLTEDAETNPGGDSHQLLTYIQADPRYESYVDLKIKTDDISLAGGKKYRDEAAAFHDNSRAYVKAGFDEDTARKARDFYGSIERSGVLTTGILAGDLKDPAADAPLPAIKGKPDDAFNENPFDAKAAIAELSYLPNPELLTSVPSEFKLGVKPPTKEELEAAAKLETAFDAEPAKHDVVEGDNLTKIAINAYGLDPSNTKAIQNAINHITSVPENNKILEESGYPREVAANHIFVGQSFILPPKESLAGEPARKENYTALDADVGVKRDASHKKLITGDLSEISGDEPIFVASVKGSLSRTMKEAAAGMGITLTPEQAYKAALEAAEANDIDNPDVVAAGREIKYTKDMFAPS